MTWAATSDLLIGDLQTSGVDLIRYMNDAENEINVALGRHYELPIPDTLTTYEASILKLIHSRLASGLFICSMATISEREDLNAWGQKLMQMAYGQLELLGTAVELTGATRVAVSGNDQRPSVSNPRGLVESPFDTYERFAYGNECVTVDPASWLA